MCRNLTLGLLRRNLAFGLLRRNLTLCLLRRNLTLGLLRQDLAFGAEPVLKVVAGFAATLFKVLKGQLSDLALRGGGVRFRSGDDGRLGGRGFRSDNDNFVQLGLLLNF